MIFTRENCKPIEAPTEAQVARSISLTKSSFSALTSADGAYVQAAGGPGLFFIEWRDAAGHHHRGAQATPVVPFPDGTTLSFSAGNVALASGEWFLAVQVNEVFGAFLVGKPFPILASMVCSFCWLYSGRLTIRSRRTASPPLNSSVKRHDMTNRELLGSQWRAVAEALCIELIAPFHVHLPDGSGHEFAVLLPQFGAPRGMLIDSEYSRAATEAASAVGFAFSSMEPETHPLHLPVNAANYIECLVDWQWSSKEQLPDWYANAV